MIKLLRLREISKGLQDIEHFVVDERGMGEMDVKQVKSDMEWLVDMIKKQQAEIDTLSMAHDDMHRLIDRDKHFLIKSNIALNRKVQELELSNILQVDEITHLDELLDGLKQQNKRYREALEFYANVNAWIEQEVTVLMDGEPEKAYDTPLALDDSGHKARKALEGEEK